MDIIARSGRSRSDRNCRGAGRARRRSSVLYDAFDFLEDPRGSGGGRGGGGGRALVHCIRVASRSAAIVVAYLMWRHVIPFDVALRRVKAARAAADPNLGFATQLLRRQPRAGAAANSPGSARRVLRLAPHLPYAPLHLVPKIALRSSSSPSSGAFAMELLDSRRSSSSSSASAWVSQQGRQPNPLKTFSSSHPTNHAGSNLCGVVEDRDRDGAR
uniref:Tyrosine specific protein phosphatases domain-containing protein n=1 Tax=Ananas comosus var. bracteatus TaxID=296719 RepID=A0A6V7PY02_ANACO|nr:unnamed protein product [Ananas comosus var. bracteatus]